MHSNQQAPGRAGMLAPTSTRPGLPPLTVYAAAALALAMLARGAHAQAEDENELALAYGGQPEVSLKTGSHLPLARAHSSWVV